MNKIFPYNRNSRKKERNIRSNWTHCHYRARGAIGFLKVNKVVRKNSNLQESRFSGILENYFEISLLDLKSFLFHFHFSISISSHFYFTFISRKEWKGIKFHPFFSRKKSEIWHQVLLKKLTIRGGCKTQNKVRQE